MYLDRTHLGTREPGIYETAVSKFRAEIFNDKTLKPKIVNGTYDLLLADRRGESPDQETFSGAIKMFHDLKVYSTFEATMMEKSQQYIMAWADRECAERELPEYVAEAVKFMDSETKRCEQFDLDLGTKRDLLTLLEDQLIQRKETELSELVRKRVSYLGLTVTSIFRFCPGLAGQY
jgi:cullin-4